MASVSVSHLILFIASLIVAAGVAGTVTTGVGRLDGALHDQTIDVSEQVRTNVKIISDAGSPVYDNSTGNITLYVKNTGSRNLPPDGTDIDLLVDGQYQTDWSITPIDGTTWQTTQVVELEIHIESLSAGDHRVKLVVGSDEEVFRFRT